MLLPTRPIPSLVFGLACLLPLSGAGQDAKDEGAAPEESSGKASNAEGQRLANTLRWSTASEVESFGFDVYRADAQEGPFRRLTASPIPAAGTSDVPTAYAYVDDTIEPDREYFYYVESISLTGERERFTPVIRAAPKSAPASAGAADDASSR